jgi:hypothetical protein
MDELKQTRRIRVTPFLKPPAASPDDSDLWMGGEASVGTQAGRHIRRSERSRPGLPLTILGLTFFGGLVLGTVVSSLLRKTAR